MNNAGGIINFRFALFSIVLVLFLIPAVTFSQNVKGVIKDKTTNEPLIGVSVVVKGTTNGVTTNLDGVFDFDPKTAAPFTLQVSYLGYTTQEILVNDLSKNVDLKLSSSDVVLKDVEVVDTRLTQKEQESALTLETMDITAIKETPAANFYEGLGQLKGVDLNSSSISFKIVNTRGFNSTRPVRSLQLIDGVDNQAPGLNFSLGNFLGASELDVQKVELVVGASSSVYGPNAFNGVINMTTKSPFVHPGLSVSAKVGERNLVETAVRYAKVFKNKDSVEKFAFKVNGFYMRANDWEADNYDPTLQSLTGADNWGGYDAVNVYGDANSSPGVNNFTSKYGKFNSPGLGIYNRTGYKERDLADYNTENMKLSGSLHYMITKDIEAQYAYSLGTGTTIFQGDNRYSLKGFLFQQHKIEIKKKDKFFLRAYTTYEDAGKSYDLVFTSLLLQRMAKSDRYWSEDYVSYWSQNIRKKILKLPGYPQDTAKSWYTDPDGTYAKADAVMKAYEDSLILWHSHARAYADGIGNPAFGNLAFFEPGTARFDSAFKAITTNTSFQNGGSMFYDKSALYHIQGEYKFTPTFMDIIIGGNFRQYLPKSEGTIFSDTNGVRIKNYEYGAYTSIEKKFLDERLKAIVSSRLDKNQNFDYVASPAASLVYTHAKKHNYRLSFSSAIRNPTLQDQYIYYNVGRAILIGNTAGFDSLVTVESLLSYYDNSYNKKELQYFSVGPVKPEKVKSIEIGYKGPAFENFFIDASYYHSWYKDFLGFKIGSRTGVDPNNGIVYNKQVYRVSANAPDIVTTQGFSAGVNYYFRKYYALNGNYSWNVLDRRGSTDPIIPAFNTPEHKFNIGFGGRDVVANIRLLNRISKKLPEVKIRNTGFNINYKWVQGYLFEGSPQFTGNIPSYDLLDAQVSYDVKKWNTTFKLGASNVLNKKRYQTYGGPKIGRMAYFSALVDLK